MEEHQALPQLIPRYVLASNTHNVENKDWNRWWCDRYSFENNAISIVSIIETGFFDLWVEYQFFCYYLHEQQASLWYIT